MKKIDKKKKKTIALVVIGILVLLLIYVSIPLKLAIPDPGCNSGFKRLDRINNRTVYSYCTYVSVIPLSEKTTTKSLLKGTVQTGFVWDGGTSYNQGLGYVIVDCQDGLKEPRTSPLIITKKKYQEEARNHCFTSH